MTLTTLVLAALGAAGGYAIACLIWPFTTCARCDGDGKHRSPSGRAWRRCKKCKGTGQRLRFGRHVLNAVTRTYERGTR